MTPTAQSTSSVIPRSNFESMTDSTLNSATTAVDEDRDSPTERHGVSDRGEDREARVLTDEFEEVFEHLRSLTFFREGSGVGECASADPPFIPANRAFCPVVTKPEVVGAVCIQHQRVAVRHVLDAKCAVTTLAAVRFIVVDKRLQI